MILTISDVIGLLEIKPSLFIPKAYNLIVGRSPDIKGIIHYAQRLHDGFPRIVVLSEIFSSLEAHDQESNLDSPGLNKIFERCFFVRNLPIGKMRWWFLPRIKAKVFRDASFDWPSWAEIYIEESILAKKSLESKMDKRGDSDSSVLVLEKKLIELEEKYIDLTAKLYIVQDSINAKSDKDKTRSIESSVGIESQAINPMSVPWPARQILFNLASAVL